MAQQDVAYGQRQDGVQRTFGDAERAGHGADDGPRYVGPGRQQGVKSGAQSRPGGGRRVPRPFGVTGGGGPRPAGTVRRDDGFGRRDAWTPAANGRLARRGRRRIRRPIVRTYRRADDDGSLQNKPITGLILYLQRHNATL